MLLDGNVAIMLLSLYLMFEFCSCSTFSYRLQKGKEQTRVGIRLCELKCIEYGQCLKFEYNTATLTCRLSSDESKERKEGYIILPTNYLNRTTIKCGSKSCSPNFRCLQARSGRSVRVKDWTQSYPGLFLQHGIRETLKSKLREACKEGHLNRVMRILSDGRVDVNGRYGKLKLTPLMVTAFYGHRDVYTLLVNKGADVSLLDNIGCNILHAASEGGHVNMVKYVLSQNIVDINSRDNAGWSPLMWAVYSGCREVYDFLVSKAADVSLVDYHHRNILHITCKGGHLNMVRYVLSQNIVDINSRDKEGMTPVMWAVYSGCREVYDFLVSKAADVSPVDYHHRNILHFACKGRHLNMVKYVLSLNIVDINSRDKEGMTPVMWAVYSGHREVYDFLVSKAADVSLVDYDDSTTLHVASNGGHVNMVKYVLSQNIVDINSRDKEGWTPLMLAACHRHREVYDFLVSKAADVSLIDYHHRNILDMACKGGHFNKVKWNIVEINSRDNGGMTPVMWEV